MLLSKAYVRDKLVIAITVYSLLLLPIESAPGREHADTPVSHTDSVGASIVAVAL